MYDEQNIRRSMLWAAYGDALGFITELCDKSTLSYRTGGVIRVTGLIPWRRKIGGQYGISWEMPKGCYSDDTQLRLAVCRSITEEGKFDVEPFAKVEMPIFISYALGAGKGTKASAESLKGKNVQWNTNFYANKYSHYIKGGGNGAAMRIQPHVWCAKREEGNAVILNNVIRNTIVTHGHPTALVGAAFHALVLRRTFLSGAVLSPAEWDAIIKEIGGISDIVHSDDDLSLIWLPEWERQFGASFDSAIKQSIQELRQDLELVRKNLESDKQTANRESAYGLVVKQIGGLDKACAGSATKTSLLASYLSFLFSDMPSDALIACVNLLHSDTDTIATMAGAIIGAMTEIDPPETVMDCEYLAREAFRLFDISQGHPVARHSYPDLLKWVPPRSNLDTIVEDGKSFYLSGFGKVDPFGKGIEQKGKYPCVWQQYRTSFDQTLLLKRRLYPNKISSHELPIDLLHGKDQKMRNKNTKAPFYKDKRMSNYSQQKLFEVSQKTSEESPGAIISVDQATDKAISSGLEERTLGRLLMQLATQENGVEKAIGFAAVVAKAKRYRMKSREKEK